MKKYLFTLLAIFVVLAPNVKADEGTTLVYTLADYSQYYNVEKFKNELQQEYEKVNSCNTKYYVIYTYLVTSESGSYLSASSICFNDTSISYLSETNSLAVSIITDSSKNTSDLFYLYLGYGEDTSYNLYDTNYSFKVPSNPLEFKNFYSDRIVLKQDDVFPTYKNLIKYKSWSDYVSNNSDTPNLTEINLDDYEYVILNLKDYNQDKAFTTNLKVKGSVGITPIYNFGQTAKDDIIGTKVQDRCNVKYDNYTDYRLSILKQDLQNNSLYVVKSCEEGSSFKFDNTIFDVTYVTADNVDDPVVTIGGKKYHVIPFDKLPSSANKNEEENYVPGESKKLNLSDIVSNITNTVSSFWDSIVNFMGLVTKFFNTLPIEIKGVAITTFSMACMIALIKFLKS